MHITRRAVVDMAVPEGSKGMTASEICKWVGETYDVEVFAETGRIKPVSNGFVFISVVMKAVEDPKHWKNSFYAIDPSIPIEWVKAAVMFFHGCLPWGCWDSVGSDGYAC